MKSTLIWALAALNVLLLVMFVGRTTGETAYAQARRPGDYIMIPGEVTGGSNSVVYIVDQSSHELSAMSYDDAMRRLDVMPTVNLDRIFASVAPANGKKPAR